MALADLRVTDLHPLVLAQEINQRATLGKVGVSLATFYNALNQFREPGPLRILGVDTSHAYFDAGTSDHNHLFRRGREADRRCLFRAIGVEGLSELPEGTQITHTNCSFG
ncbi:transcriptional repressor [Mesorhizobium sp. M1423]